MKITKANEDYLEAILNSEKDGSSRSIDVARLLGVSKAAVSIAMTELVSKGLIEKKSYGDIILTDNGRKLAIETYHKHKLIKRFLIGIGVDEKKAEMECCKIEHILSDETIKHLELFCKKNNF